MKKFEMLNIIYQDCKLTAKEKLVAQYFVYKTNKAGACYPCVDTIAEQCSVSRRTVQRATKKLEEKGYIIKEKRFKLGRQTSNLYSFNTLLIAELQREKECECEQECKETIGSIEEMEIIDFEEMLCVPEVWIEDYDFQDQDEEMIQDEEWIDFDELVASCIENDSVWDNDMEEDINALFEVQEKGQTTSVPGPEESIRKRKISFSIAMQIISFICTFPEQRIVGKSVVYIAVLKHNCIVINPGFLLCQENGAFIKSIGAFFPP